MKPEESAASWQGRRIVVLFGGLSSEREVSLKTGAGVLAALLERGHDAVGVDWAPGTSLPGLLEAAGGEVVWNALHGTFGEDGAVQGMCACLGLRCTGSGILASALAMDKVAAKRIFESHGVPTPRWTLIPRAASAAAARAPGGPLADWAVPLVIKPGNEGSSVGVTVVSDESGIAPAITEARVHRGPTLVEEYIGCHEVSVAVLDGVVIGSCEMRPSKGFYDYEAKYLRGDTEYLVPPPMAAETLREIEDAGFRAYRALGCSGYGRTDLRVDEVGRPFVLEVNTLPGMTGTSLVPKIARAAGIDYGTLCERILASAFADGGG